MSITIYFSSLNQLFIAIMFNIPVTIVKFYWKITKLAKKPAADLRENGIPPLYDVLPFEIHIENDIL